MLKVDYDQEADAVYVTLREAQCAYTRSLDALRNVDYAADGGPIGVELLRVSGGVDLTDVPNGPEIGDALRGSFRIYA
jgi:uncharacterized protein YuzE